MLAPVYAKNGNLMHSDGCRMAFGRYDAGNCPRCAELASGAAARPRFGGKITRQADDQRRCDEITAHFRSHKHLSGGCGPVCTFGDY